MLGECHILSALSSISERPDWVSEMFNNSSIINSKGVYSINLFVDGEKQEIVIDDYFPCYGDRFEPLFARSPCKGLWPMFLEKAWAKTFGNYVKAERMLPEHVLEELLGSPAQGFWVSNFTA